MRKRRRRERTHLVEPYDHDCDVCQWVGWFTLRTDLPMGNVYLCKGKTVVIRFSSDGPDYWSATAGDSTKGAIEEPLWMARSRERRKGLDKLCSLPWRLRRGWRRVLRKMGGDGEW